VLEVRPLTEADLQHLREKSVGANRVKNLRDSHHMVARLIAFGLRLPDVAERTGYSLARIYTLSMDPSVKELVAKYRGVVDESYSEAIDENRNVAAAVVAKGLRHVNDAFDAADEAGELIPISTVSKILPDIMDRFGYGKQSMNVNVNIGLASRMEAFRERRKKLLAK
jgi:hypothetical protein